MTELFAKTLLQLQQHLDFEGKTIKELAADCFYKMPAKQLVCNDGTTASVQASENHYCSPRENTGPYHQVEVWCVSCQDVTEFDYNSEEPSACVPVEKIAQFIINHGGFKE